ncbi:MAG: hypothetical protein L3J57_07325 [Desulfuromusa sp.]|nr:hypothetical protein [Desulfuromusa sp.]
MDKTRRQALAAMGVATGAAAVFGSTALNAFAKNEQPAAVPSALPWLWKKLDPMEAGKRAFNYYHEKGG